MPSKYAFLVSKLSKHLCSLVNEAEDVILIRKSSIHVDIVVVIVVVSIIVVVVVAIIINIEVGD